MVQGFRNFLTVFLIALGVSVSLRAATLHELQPFVFQWPGDGWHQTSLSVRDEGDVAVPEYAPVPHGHRNPDDAYNSTIEGRVALISAIFPIISLVAFSITSFPFFIVPMLVFGVIAVVFGAIGMRRRKRGFAIAGFTLGLTAIVAGFAVLAAL